jgi:hypothetical protein
VVLVVELGSGLVWIVVVVDDVPVMIGTSSTPL